MKYLTGVSNDYMMEAAESRLWGDLGLLLSAGTWGAGAKCDYCSHIPRYRNWAMDNGCFSGPFDEAKFFERLDWILENVDGASYSCLFAVAPDVLGDAEATLAASRPVLPKIRERGIPAAYVLQEGASVESLPWGEFDVLFIGGSDDFKLAYPAERAGAKLSYDVNRAETLAVAKIWARCIEEGIPIHVGRVNSRIRMAFAVEMGAESCDGTMIAFSGRDGLRRLERWLPAMNGRSKERFLFSAC